MDPVLMLTVTQNPQLLLHTQEVNILVLLPFKRSSCHCPTACQRSGAVSVRVPRSDLQSRLPQPEVDDTLLHLISK
jgi:hypothetical protein